MEVLEQTEWIFKDPLTGEVHPVILNPDVMEPLEKGKWYLIGEEVYECIGEIHSVKEMRQGTISRLNGMNGIELYCDDDMKNRFSERNIIEKNEYDKSIKNSNDYDELMESYIADYEKGYNLMAGIPSTPASNGDVFMPELRPDDDPFEKVIKSMIRHMKVVLNDYKQYVEKPHILDNLRSALSGATKNMSIVKFLLWCKTLQLDWEIRLVDVEPTDNPIGSDVVVTNQDDGWKDIQPVTEKGIFTVPLSKKDDPLKRVIKLALYKKKINTKNCEDRSSSAHLINNMKSALKNDQKMTMLYFMSWCELLDLIFEIKVTNPKTGIYFQSVGFDLYTNAKNEDTEEGSHE